MFMDMGLGVIHVHVRLKRLTQEASFSAYQHELLWRKSNAYFFFFPPFPAISLSRNALSAAPLDFCDFLKAISSAVGGPFFAAFFFLPWYAFVCRVLLVACRMRVSRGSNIPAGSEQFIVEKQSGCG